MTATKETDAPQNHIGRLPEYACSHWTGYGIDSELAQSYLHVLSALKARRAYEKGDPNPFGHDCKWCGNCIAKMTLMEIHAIEKAEKP